jgi:hypothetical protein
MGSRGIGVAPLVQRAVWVALASACGTSIQSQIDGGMDATTPDGPTSNDGNDDVADGADGGTYDDTYIAPLPLPDGCIVTGKPDHFLPCGYTETINDINLCQVDPTIDTGVQDAATCFVLCDPTEPDCIFYGYTNPDGSVTPLINCGAGCVGRLHEDARRAEDGRCARLRGTPGEWLARAAELEGAAVDAFELLAAELEDLGAPADLVQRARDAADDERRHARDVGGLARMYGGRASVQPAPESRTRELRAFAMENALEGCVRETFGAAIALWQAERATDARVRDVMRGVARDELAHAELGWRIDAWVTSLLSTEDRQAVTCARQSALGALADTWTTPSVEALGLPSSDEVRVLAGALQRELQTASL